MKDIFDWEICSNVVIFELSKRSVQMQRKHFKCQKVEERHSSNFCNKDKGYRNPVYLHSNHLSFIFGINLESFLGK